MNTHDTTLTIVMPVFNHPEDTREMIESIRANTFEAWRLIAVDDGSDRPTLDMLHEYARKDSRITVCSRSRQPKGAQTCRNIGLSMATGEYIVFFDSDDIVAPYCLEQRVRAMQRRDDVDFLVFPSAVYDGREMHRGPHAHAYGRHIYADDIAQFASRRLPFVVWNNIYRTASLRRHSLTWDESLRSLQDADFNISALAAGLRYDYVAARPDYGYRVTSQGSVSKKISGNEHIQSLVYANGKMYDTVRAAWGGSYDSHLLDGTLCIYNANMSGGGINLPLAESLAASVMSRVPALGRKLVRSIRLTRLLSRLLPPRLARQIGVAPYLLRRSLQARLKLRRLAALAAHSESQDI